jgi:hypothetical protein
MADVKITALTANPSPSGNDVIPVSKADGSITNKVTLTNVVALAVSSGAAIASDTTGISGADQVTNIVKLTQAEYDALATSAGGPGYVSTTAYFIVG